MTKKTKLVQGNKRTMEYIGEDNFSAPIYKCVETGNLWKDISLGESEIPQLYDCGNEVDGDPGFPIRPELELHFISKPPSKENKFNYMMLSRMQSDCEYYLNFGNRYKGRLSFDDEQKHIDEMKKLHNGFAEDKKPEWLTMEQIEKYELQMVEHDITDAMTYSGKVIYKSERGFGTSFETSLYVENDKLYAQSEKSGKLMRVKWDVEGESVKPI